MTSRRGTRGAVVFGVAIAYAAIAFEILFMILPFAVYFYAVYAPVLGALASSPLSRWTTEFFLPHMVFTRDPVIVALSWLQVLFPLGLALFCVAAIPLYYAKIFRKTMATSWLYSVVRHPQYLALSLSGFGLLLYWPRFIILLFYVTMLFVYYLLARDEERRMLRRFGRSYEDYMRRTPMFLPGEPGGRVFRAVFGALPRGAGIAVLYVVVLGLSLLASFGLRSYAADAIPRVHVEGVTVVPVLPQPLDPVRRLFMQALEDKEVRSRVDQGLNLAYVLPADYFLLALLTEEPRGFSDDVIERFPEVLEWHRRKFGGTIGRFFRIFANYLGMVASPSDDPDVLRLIFVRARDHGGRAVPPGDVLGVNVLRTPALLVDVDLRTARVIAVRELSGRHKWGAITMPAF